MNSETLGVLPQWEVDVAVAVNFFCRPDYLEKQFEVIKAARPSRLYLIADGPRDGNHEEIAACKRCREIVSVIPWECDVTRIYADSNMGLFDRYFSAMTEVFEKENKCIFLEDDVIPSISFFRYCKELLDRYENDTRIFHISGWNYLGEYDDPNSDYFFSGEAPLCGYGLWRRSFESMNLDFLMDGYVVDRAMRLARLIKPGYERRIKKTLDNPLWEGHVPHVEFYKNVVRLTEGQLGIVPSKNLITNIGVGGVHTGGIELIPRGLRRLYYAKTYELDFPLKHPRYVVRDLFYDSCANRILAWNMPLVRGWRKLESLVLHIRYGDFKRIHYKIKTLFNKDPRA